MKKILTLMIIAGCASNVMLATTILPVSMGGTNTGNLKTVLSAENLKTCEYLVLNGEIDARDFKTMRDAMPALTTVDLRSADIVEYTDTEGTAGTDESTYEANEIPSDAFNNKSTLTTIYLPTSCTKIGKYAFYNCSYLTTFPTLNNITSIGSNAFALCTGLTEINISRYVSSIGEKAFFRCKADIAVDINNANYASQDGILFNKSKTTLFQCPTLKTGSYTLPSTVTTIETSAFYACKNLTGIILPTSLTTINASAFHSCTGLSSMTLPANLTTIGTYAFYQCNELVTLTIPSKVTTLGASFASACEKLKTVSIPAAVTSMGKNIFSGCSALTSISALNATPLALPVNEEVFSGVDKTSCTLYVPVGSKTAYEAASQWEDFTKISESTFTSAKQNHNTSPTATVENHQLIVENIQPGSLVTVHNLQGHVIAKEISSNTKLTIELLQRGIYLIQADEKSIKVMY
ncbi:putative secreted protein (Por secretion system target) [Breznakibacter xylanolyticus]|uniref:Putative secreted protein (Por secretion system target) n=1 Tax=Breznakibacter xylanolyticus TaxID=990 RepID=A0A2W7MRY0_9BACT|nr:leucine-rich repeat domain-containing protein [Breznakibacter xylanolyticus]PZX10640.1 putative secreted protein (Por secretion system target) [Breznakibacter xylanolyticus]